MMGGYRPGLHMCCPRAFGPEHELLRCAVFRQHSPGRGDAGGGGEGWRLCDTQDPRLVALLFLSLRSL